jgi:formamidopyrimidine-DNA glycosylase
MPELPEVETVCRSLRPHLLGRTVVRVAVRQPRLRVPVDITRAKGLAGQRIGAIERVAKYILLHLDGPAVWLFHLGMSGKLICTDAATAAQKHDHIIVDLDDGRQLRYHDPRRFGLAIVTRAEELGELPQLRHIGVDPFAETLTTEYLYSFTRTSDRRIRDLLLDQQIVAGLGNIYANEVLAMVRVKPTTRAWRLTRKQVAMIAAAIPELLSDAIQWCGTSFSDYRDADDKSGEFQHHLRVYDRDGAMCRTCPSIIKRVVIGNRSAYYCPACQK